MPGIVFLPFTQLRLQGASYPLCTVHHTRFFELSTALGELYPLTIEPRSSGGFLHRVMRGEKKKRLLSTSLHQLTSLGPEWGHSHAKVTVTSATTRM